jgi:exopolysaccharide production protein ExoQ
MIRIVIFIEQLMTVIFLMIYSGTPVDPFLTNGFATEDADRSIYRLLYTITYIVSIFLITLRWRKGLYAFTKDKSIWALLVICALSVFWSSDVEATIRRVFSLVGTTAFGVYIASRYTLKQQLKLCAIMFGISAFMCVVFSLFLPVYGIQIDVVGSAWRGFYIHKNVLGKRFLLGGMIFLFLAIKSPKNYWFLWAGYSICFVLILLSKSTTSLGNFIIITVAFQAYQLLRWKYEKIIPIVLLIATISVAFYTWFITGADALLATTGKDTTLTGRTDLWPAVWDMIMKKPWLGYGYGAFWLGLSSESANVLRVVGWDAPNSHNGFLDIFLSIGFLGFFTFAIGFFVNLWYSIYWIRLSNKSNNMWLLIYLTFTIISNTTETTLMDQNSIEWILYVSAVLSAKLNIETNMFSNNPKTIDFSNNH